ncbi:hypothetical protein EJB05_32769, partial [Eragrostis curvula]
MAIDGVNISERTEEGGRDIIADFAKMDIPCAPHARLEYTIAVLHAGKSLVISVCAAAGDIPYLVSHLRDDHKVDMHSGCTFNHRYVKSNPREVENATWMLTVFHCFGQYFCLHFEAFQLGMAPVYMAFLRFMGDENEAKNYSYSLEVGANGRKMVWEGTPRSVRDSHRKVRDSHDGLIIQRNMALFFSAVIGRSLSSGLPVGSGRATDPRWRLYTQSL